ncbi:probable RNA-directed DNA polymerase from transposon BS [Trichonephila clavipes]|nr:probable RNA-directed DNA polymerase from transposon BS [Trichonephila clavipes]
MAVVIPILKPNSDDCNTQNEHPISILSSLSKAYEFLILNRLKEHCLARNIIIPEQHGFVTKCSTATQLLRVTELVHTSFQNHQATGMLFVDIAKAFDKIWHDGLISKMMSLGFSDQILKIIHSYLNLTELRVRVKNCLSIPRPVKSGIPQGSLLGPRLFNLYINDIPKADNVHLAMYVDDTAIIIQHTYNFKIIKRLQNYTTRLQIRLVAWKIKVNASKSASLLFTKQRYIGNLRNIYIFDRPIPWVTEFKYLVFMLDAKLNFSPHIRAALQKAAGMSRTLHFFSRKCIDFMKESKLTLDFDQKSLIIPDNQIKQLPKVEKPVEFDLSDTKLGEGQKQKLRHLFNSFKGLFSDQQWLNHVLYHEIDTGDKGPVVSRTYRYDRVKHGIIDYNVEKMLQEGAIHPIQSLYASPVVLTRKNNDFPPDSTEAYRFAIDYRKLNALIKYPRYPLPVIDDLITNIPHTGILSTLDLKSGYFQLTIIPKDIEKTAFITRNGTFAFLRMPFGFSGGRRQISKRLMILY